MCDFHDSTDIFVNPFYFGILYLKGIIPELALKTGILVPKVEYDLSKFKLRP